MINRDKQLMETVTNYASREMKLSPGLAESAALELLCSVSLWLCEYYKHCDDPEKYPVPTIKVSTKELHNLL